MFIVLYYIDLIKRIFVLSRLDLFYYFDNFVLRIVKYLGLVNFLDIRGDESVLL